MQNFRERMVLPTLGEAPADRAPWELPSACAHAFLWSSGLQPEQPVAWPGPSAAARGP